MDVPEYILSRIEEGAPGFDLDWETMREIANDVAQGKFAAGSVKPSSELATNNETVNKGLSELADIQKTSGKNRDNFYRNVNKQFGAAHEFDLGVPEGMLKGHLPNKPIHLKLKTLLRKRAEGYKNKHPFDFDEVSDIATSVHNPAIILRNEGGKSGVREFFEAKSGRAFMVAIKPDGEINDISTLFPKDCDRLVRMIKMLKGRRGDVLAINTEKAISMLRSRSDTASAELQDDLSDAISLLKSWSGSQGGLALYVDKVKIATVGLEERTNSTLSTLSNSGDFRSSIPQTGEGAQGGAAKFAESCTIK